MRTREVLDRIEEILAPLEDSSQAICEARRESIRRAFPLRDSVSVEKATNKEE